MGSSIYERLDGIYCTYCLLVLICARLPQRIAADMTRLLVSGSGS